MRDLVHGAQKSVFFPILSTVFFPNARAGQFGNYTGRLRDILTRIDERLKAVGLTESRAAKIAGLSDSAIRDMRRSLKAGKDNAGVSSRTLNKLAPILETSSEWLLTGRSENSATWSSVAIMGFVGAGSEVEPDYEQVPPEGLDQIEIPFPLPDEMIAFKVRGISMLPVFKDGTIIVVYREQKKPLESFYGEDAAVRTSDGRRFIKTINRGINGGVNLASSNAPTIEGVHLDWVGEIFAVLPPSTVRKVARQGGIQGQLRLKSA